LELGYLFAPDEYMHVYNACILQEVFDNAMGSWYGINFFPEPNLFGHVWLYLAGKVMPYSVAEKFFVFIIAAGNGYAFLSAGGGWPTTPTKLMWRTTLALLALGLWLSASWQMGFVNYLTGMVALLVALQHTAGTSRLRGLAVASWAVIIYFCHPLALLFFLGTVALRELLNRNLIDERMLPRAGAWGSWFRDIALWFVIPVVLLTVYICTHSEVSTWAGASPWRLLGLVYFHNDIALFAASELPLAQGWMALVAAAILYGGVRAFQSGGAQLTFAAVGGIVLLAAILLVPDYLAGGALIHQRLMPFWFIWLLWCARAYAPSMVPKGVLVAALIVVLGLALGLTAYRRPVLAKAEDYFTELREFSKLIPVGSTVLPASVSAHGLSSGNTLSRKPILHHFAGIMGCERQLVILDNYEAFVGYFPLKWKSTERDPFKIMTRGIEAHPAQIPDTAAAWLDNHVDYVLTLGPLDKAFEDSTAAWLLPHLEVAATSDTGIYTLARVR